MSITKLLMTAALVTFVSAGAFADQPAPAAGTTASPAPVARGQDRQPSPEKFEESKAKVLKHISERIAKMQEKQACAQAATTREAMKVCFPKWGEKRGRGGNSGAGVPDGIQ